MEILQDVISIKQGKGGNFYKFVVKIPIEEGWIDNVKLSIYSTFRRKEEKVDLAWKRNESGLAIFETEKFLETCAVYYYHYEYIANGKKKEVYHLKGVYGKNYGWKLSVNFFVDESFAGSIVYHVFLDSFKRGNYDIPTGFEDENRRHIYPEWGSPIKWQDSNGEWNTNYYAGNLRGVIDKLDYIKSLGVEFIFLSPICYSQSNHRYDTLDYMQIDPYLGSENDMRELSQKAHERGIKIILDVVFNHVGNLSKYCNSPKYKNYIQKDQDGNPQNWWGVKSLEVLDKNSKEVIEYLLGPSGALHKYFSDWGIDGIRVDVIDNLPDSFIKEMNVRVQEEYVVLTIIGEVWESPLDHERWEFRIYISSALGMTTVMNYYGMEFLQKWLLGNISGKEFQYVLEEILYTYPDLTIYTLLNSTSTHDITRAISVMAGKGLKKEKGARPWDTAEEDREKLRTLGKLNLEEYEKASNMAKFMYSIMYFLPGAVSIFYGDEAGMTGIGNLLNRGPYPWGNEDVSMQNHFRQLSEVRKSSPWMKMADMKIISCSDEMFVFERQDKEHLIRVYANRSSREVPLFWDHFWSTSKIVYKFGQNKSKTLAPLGILVLLK